MHANVTKDYIETPFVELPQKGVTFDNQIQLFVWDCAE